MNHQAGIKHSEIALATLGSKIQTSGFSNEGDAGYGAPSHQHDQDDLPNYSLAAAQPMLPTAPLLPPGLPLPDCHSTTRHMIPTSHKLSCSLLRSISVQLLCKSDHFACLLFLFISSRHGLSKFAHGGSIFERTVRHVSSVATRLTLRICTCCW